MSGWKAQLLSPTGWRRPPSDVWPEGSWRRDVSWNGVEYIVTVEPWDGRYRRVQIYWLDLMYRTITSHEQRGSAAVAAFAMMLRDR